MRRVSMLLLVVAITMIGILPAQAGVVRDAGSVADTLQCKGDPPPPTIADVPPGTSPEGIWYGCLCEDWFWWSCDNVNYYECCQQMVWNDDDPNPKNHYWQCMTGYYLTCGLPPGCDAVPW